MDAKKGTTTVGIVGKDYVILAADKLASMGDLEADRRTQKVYPISDHMAMTTAGLVGDAQLLVRFLKTKINRMKIEEGKEPSGKRVATLLGTILNSTKYMPYMVQLLLGSYVEEPSAGSRLQGRALRKRSNQAGHTGGGDGKAQERVHRWRGAGHRRGRHHKGRRAHAHGRRGSKDQEVPIRGVLLGRGRSSEEGSADSRPRGSSSQGRARRARNWHIHAQSKVLPRARGRSGKHSIRS